jgi:methylenetetrahydrofolate dehydrogenase (NADP+)/methenyltetrahydrofolate cyclohydrolase
MDKRIDVAAFVARRRTAIAEAVRNVQQTQHITPTFGVILVGENPASLSYIKGKTKAAAAVGMDTKVFHLAASVSEADLLAEVARLNAQPSIHGFIVQLPLPPHIDEGRIFAAIEPTKDIDGLHPDNLGRMVLGAPHLLPCTPQGIIALLDDLHVDLAGKHVVIVGRSNIVGKPVALLALARDATVTMCHSKTEDLAAYTRTADVLIVAVGNPQFIDATYVKHGVIVIDVGVNKLADTGKLVGDVDYEAIKDIAAAITPVPGGVGPLTITMLLENTLKALRLAQDATRAGLVAEEHGEE